MWLMKDTMYECRKYVKNAHKKLQIPNDQGNVNNIVNLITRLLYCSSSCASLDQGYVNKLNKIQYTRLFYFHITLPRFSPPLLWLRQTIQYQFSNCTFITISTITLHPVSWFRQDITVVQWVMWQLVKLSQYISVNI